MLVESCRGTAGSQGVFRPFFDEQNDGEDTVEWIARQPWFTGDLALWGGSYLGNAAWAVANSSAKDRVKAIGLHVTLTNFPDRTYAFDGFMLESTIGWTLTMLHTFQTSGMSVVSTMLRARKTRALAQLAIATIPLRMADRVFAPEGVSWWQDWMDHAEPGHPWWEAIDYGKAAETIPPTVMTAGWYDIFLPWQLKDFMTAQRAGRDVRITIGPWMHAALAVAAESLRQSITLFHERFGIELNKTGDGTSKPRVRLFLMGANEWREYPSCPFRTAVIRPTFCTLVESLLSKRPPLKAGAHSITIPPGLRHRFMDRPSQVPAVRGTWPDWSPCPDVLVFSSEPLTADLDVIGSISSAIFLRSNTEYTDLYVCLCDVAPNFHSTNVCDGYKRLRPDRPVAAQAGADGGRSRQVHVEFWPTAYRFRRGHRIRAIVASGAHPRYARNPGSGEPLGDACTMVIAHQEILHGPQHPSAITLPTEVGRVVDTV